jgi:hypothetical protein
VLDLVYEVLGRPIGIAPYSTSASPVDARRQVVPPENGLEVPWHQHRTGFLIPPCGQVEEPRWIQKAIREARLGWEGVVLLPANTGAPWFEALYQNSPCICLWGSPHLKVEGRIWPDDDAMRHTQFVYLGPRYEAFVRVFSRAGHLIYPRYDQSLTVRIAGRTMPSVEVASPVPMDAANKNAERREHAGRLDPWANAIATQPHGMKVKDLTPSLRAPIEDASVHDMAHGMLLHAHASVGIPTLSVPRREKGAVAPVDPRQVNLPLYEDGRAAHNDAERERFDRCLVDTLTASPTPLGRADLMSVTPCTQSEYRSAIKRLKKASLIEQVGRGKRALYRAIQPPRTEQDDESRQPPKNGNAARTTD